MRNKKRFVIIICAAVALAAFIIGYCGVLDLAKQTGKEVDTASDQLIGAFITKEHIDLFDVDSFFQDNISQLLNDGTIDEQKMSQCGERLYAVNIPDKYHPNVIFEGTDGISIYSACFEAEGNVYWASSRDDGCTDFCQHLIAADELERIEIEGTVYSSTLNGWECFYVNPMYQTSDGSIYVIPGQGNAFSSETVGPGMSWTQTLTESKAMVINGEKETVESEIKVTFTYMDPPDTIEIIQFNNENQIIAQDSFRADIIPQELSPNEAAEYIIIETVATALDGSKSISRQLIQHEDDFAYTFSVREDGICVQHVISINWDN